MNQSFSELLRRTAESLKAFQKSLPTIAKGFQIWMEASEQNAENLARLGWTLPAWASMRQSVEIYKLGTEEEIEAYFLNMYREDRPEYGLLKNGLLTEDNLTRWRPLIRQSFRAYERGDYQIVVPALLTVFEGLVSELSGRFDQKPNIRQATLHKLNTASGHTEQWVARSVDLFVSEVFKRHSFKQKRPVRINRHWILHGRDHADWSKSDALKLFNAIHTVSTLW